MDRLIGIGGELFILAEELEEMESLPSELLIYLLKELNHVPSIVKFSLTSTKYYHLIQNNQFLWKNLFQFTHPYDSYFPSITHDGRNQPDTAANDWKKLVSDIYRLRNNWNRGRAIVSKLPGKLQPHHSILYGTTGK